MLNFAPDVHEKESVHTLESRANDSPSLYFCMVLVMVLHETPCLVLSKKGKTSTIQKYREGESFARDLRLCALESICVLPCPVLFLLLTPTHVPFSL